MTILPSDLQSIVTANSATYQAPLTENSTPIVQLHPGFDDEPISCSFTDRKVLQAEGISHRTTLVEMREIS
jgi:hypothetical protein